jgi:hypothetical protein
MIFAEMLDAFEERRLSRVAAMRWCNVWRYVDFLVILDFNLRPLPRGRLPLRPLRRQMRRNRLRREPLS